MKKSELRKLIQEVIKNTLNEENEVLVYHFNTICKENFGENSYYILGSHVGDGVTGTIRCATGAVGGEMIPLKQNPTKIVHKGDQIRPTNTNFKRR